MSRDCCVALPHDVMGSLQFVMVAFPDHTHYFWCARAAHAQTENCLYTGKTLNKVLREIGDLGNYAFSSIQPVHVFTIIYFVSALQHLCEICVLT